MRNKNNSEAINNSPIKVLQFGTGNFLRGFVDWMIEEINEKTDFNGAVHIIQSHGKSIPSAYIEQKNLYHVVTRGLQRGKIIDQLNKITCISAVSNPNHDYENYLKLGELPDLKVVVSNTTEAGIYFDPNDKPINEVSNTFPGKLAALLYKRYQHYSGNLSKGLLILPCELIENNGIQLKEAILAYSKLWGLPSDFNVWINQGNTFCNTLVDRIVPGFPKESETIQERLEFKDELLVMAEPYYLWAIEGDKSLNEIFPIAELGPEIKFVNDLKPLRTQKVRILNGAHTVLVPVAYLAGFRTVREAVEDDVIESYLKSTIFEEIIPSLEMDQGQLIEFANEVLDRFRNPFIRHELLSISLNSVSKFRVRVLPSMLDYHEKFGYWPANLVKSLSALLLFYKGEINGKEIPLKDEPWVLKFFEEEWNRNNTKETVNAILANEQLWSKKLSELPGLSDYVYQNLIALE